MENQIDKIDKSQLISNLTKEAEVESNSVEDLDSRITEEKTESIANLSNQELAELIMQKEQKLE